MQTSILRALLFSSLSSTLFAGSLQEPTEQTASGEFASPVRLRAGDDFVGAKRLYPSPVMRDVDADGRLDIVIGDLFGAITFVSRDADQERIGFAARQKLKDRDGEPIDFNNW
ncbi:MAG: hypothetical protein ACI8QC_002450 [Planctomycetota bacterium]|jgi:hypothetical protein